MPEGPQPCAYNQRKPEGTDDGCACRQIPVEGRSYPRRTCENAGEPAHHQARFNRVREEDATYCRSDEEGEYQKHADNLAAHHVLIASLAQLEHIDEANAALNRLLELDPGLTIERLLEIFPLSRYRNLDGMLNGLRKAGLPE